MCELDVCEGVTCYGDAICHEHKLACFNKTSPDCFIMVPECSDKTIEDYERERIDSRNVERKKLFYWSVKIYIVAIETFMKPIIFQHTAFSSIFYFKI